MSAHNTTKKELISQLFWQMEIGADESLFATPCFKEKNWLKGIFFTFGKYQQI